MVWKKQESDAAGYSKVPGRAFYLGIALILFFAGLSLAQQPVGFWKLDTDSGSIAYDYGPHILDGTTYGNTYWLNGETGLHFDSGYVDIPFDTNLDIFDSVSLTAWIRLDSTGSTQSIIGKKADTVANYHLFVSSTGHLSFEFYNAGMNIYQDALTLPTGQWVFVAASFNAATDPVLMVDSMVRSGSWLSGGPQVLNTNASPATIGASNTGMSEQFRGDIAHARIYNTSLSLTALDSIRYSDASFLGSLTTPQLEAYWPTNEGSGSIIYDNSAYANDAYFYGSTGFDISSQAINFPDSFSYAYISDDSYLSVPGPISLSAWIKTNASGAFQNILTRGVSPGINYSLMVTDSNRVAFEYQSSGLFNAFESFGTISTNTWHHITVTYDYASNPVFYIDGMVSGGQWMTTDSLMSPPDTSYLGISLGVRDTATKADHFSGSIGHIRIYTGIIDSFLVDSLIMAESSYFTNSGNSVSDTIPVLRANWNMADSGTSLWDWVNGTYASIYGTAFMDSYYNALIIDNAGDFAEALPNSNLDLDSSLSFSVWFFPDSATGTYQALFNKGNTSVSNYALEITSSGQPSFSFKSSGLPNVYTANGTIAYGEWNHIALTYKAGSYPEIYINGMYTEGSWTTTDSMMVPDINTQSLIIGAMDSLGTEGFSGGIGNFHIYKGLLAQYQIDSLIQSDSSHYLSNPPGGEKFSLISGNSGILSSGGVDVSIYQDLLHFYIENDSSDISIDSLRFQIQGAMPMDMDMVELYEDVDKNGILDSLDDYISITPYFQDSTVLIVPYTSDTLFAYDTAAYFIAANFWADSIPFGDTLKPFMQKDWIFGTGIYSGSYLIPDAGTSMDVYGNTFWMDSSATGSPETFNLIAGNSASLPNGGIDFSSYQNLLHFYIENDSSQIGLDSLRFGIMGINPGAIDMVELYRDLDGNGFIDSLDPWISITPYFQDSTILLALGSNDTIFSYDTAAYIISASFRADSISSTDTLKPYMQKDWTFATSHYSGNSFSSDPNVSMDVYGNYLWKQDTISTGFEAFQLSSGDINMLPGGPRDLSTFTPVLHFNVNTDSTPISLDSLKFEFPYGSAYDLDFVDLIKDSDGNGILDSTDQGINITPYFMDSVVVLVPYVADTLYSYSNSSYFIATQFFTDSLTTSDTIQTVMQKTGAFGTSLNSGAILISDSSISSDVIGNYLWHESSGSDTIAPAPVMNFTATVLDEWTAIANWSSVSDSDAVKLRVQARNDGIAPTGPYDGMKTWDFNPYSTQDTLFGLNSDESYELAAFVQDGTGNWSILDSGSVASITMPGSSSGGGTMGLHVKSILYDSVANRLIMEFSENLTTNYNTNANIQMTYESDDNTIYQTLSAPHNITHWPDSTTIAINLTAGDADIIESWPEYEHDMEIDISDSLVFGSLSGTWSNPLTQERVSLHHEYFETHWSFYLPDHDLLYIGFSKGLADIVDPNGQITLSTYQTGYGMTINHSQWRTWGNMLELKLDSLQADAIESWPEVQSRLRVDISAGLVTDWIDSTTNPADTLIFTEWGNGLQVKHTDYDDSDRKIYLDFHEDLDSNSLNAYSTIKIYTWGDTANSVLFSTPLNVTTDSGHYSTLVLSPDSLELITLESLTGYPENLVMDVGAGLAKSAYDTTYSTGVYGIPLEAHGDGEPVQANAISPYDIVVSWGAPEISDSLVFVYRTDRFPQGPDDGTMVSSYAVTDTVDTLSGLTPGTLYYIGGFSLEYGAWSTPDQHSQDTATTFPQMIASPPTNLTVVTGSSLPVLHWDVDPNAYLDSVQVRVRMDRTPPQSPTDGRLVGFLPAVIDSLALHKTLPGRIYTYGVFTRNSDGYWSVPDSLSSIDYKHVVHDTNLVIPVEGIGWKPHTLRNFSLQTWPLDSMKIGLQGDTNSGVWQAFADSFQVDLSSLPQGKFDLNIRFKDSHGNQSRLFYRRVLLDSSAPKISIMRSAYHNHRTWPEKIHGGAYDTISGLNKVSVTIKRLADTTYFDGTNWAKKVWSHRAQILDGWHVPLPSTALNTGNYHIEATAYDNALNPSNRILMELGFEENRSPNVKSILMQDTTAQDAPVEWTYRFEDMDMRDSITTIPVHIPAWMTTTVFDTTVRGPEVAYSTLAGKGTPLQTHVGVDSIVMEVMDLDGFVLRVSKTFLVSDINDAPVFTEIPTQLHAIEDAAFAYEFQASDPDPDAVLTYSLVSAPEWLSLSGNKITGTPGDLDVGVFPLEAKVGDGTSTALFASEIKVENINDVPVLSGSQNLMPESQRFREDSVSTFSVTVKDDDMGDSIKLASTLPGFLILNKTELLPGEHETRFEFTASPLQADTGSRSFSLSFKDLAGEIASVTVNAFVYETNDPPLAIIKGIQIAGGAARVALSVSDEDGKLPDTKFHYQLRKNDTISLKSGIHQIGYLDLFPLANGQYQLSVIAEDKHGLKQTEATRDLVVIQGASSVSLDSGVWLMKGPLHSTLPLTSLGEKVSVAHWDDAGPQDKLYNKYRTHENLSHLTRSRGYWLYLNKPVNLQAGQGDLLDTSVTLGLKNGGSGWNQIANPFPYPVNISSSGLNFWSWNAGTRDMTEAGGVLQPWQAYFVKVDSSVALKIKNQPLFTSSATALMKSGTSALMKSSFQSRMDWRSQLILKAMDYEDRSNVFGISSLPSALLKSASEPPRMGSYLNLSFLDENQGRYASDIRSEMTSQEEWWDFVVHNEGTPLRKASVSVDQIGQLQNEGLHVFIVSKGEATELHADSEVPIDLGSNDRYYSLVVSTNSSFPQLLKKGFQVMQNFPNPAFSHTTFKFHLPHSWDAEGRRITKPYQVGIKVYDMRGRVIKEVVKAEFQAGEHRLLWEIRDENGRYLPKGQYIYRFTADGFVKTKKLTIMR